MSAIFSVTDYTYAKDYKDHSNNGYNGSNSNHSNGDFPFLLVTYYYINRDAQLNNIKVVFTENTDVNTEVFPIIIKLDNQLNGINSF